MSAKEHQQDANRDPLTGEPRSHPVGTGLGAVAGGAAAGAATGTFAGPVGTAIGAAAGAVVGGFVGKAIAEGFDPTEAGDLRRFLDYTVCDRDGSKIGSIDAVWEDHTGRPAYVAVRTGWLGLGRAHVVPAQQAEVNEQKKIVRLPFTAAEIKSAPSFDSQDDINEDSEFTISSHYGLERDWYRDHGQARLEDDPELRGDDTTLRAEDTLPPPLAQPARGDDTRIRLNEENIRVGKREVEAGGVRLRKIVRVETVDVPVELKREEIAIERTPVSGEGGTVSDASFAEDDIFIPLRREEPVIEKSVRAREEIRVTKRSETEKENVSGEIRREGVEIERESNRGAGPRGR